MGNVTSWEPTYLTYFKGAESKEKWYPSEILSVYLLICISKWPPNCLYLAQSLDHFTLVFL